MAADPVFPPGAQMDAAIQALERKYGVDIVVTLVDSPNGPSKGQIAISGPSGDTSAPALLIPFNDAFGTLGWRTALQMAETYLRTAPRVSQLLGVPIPPEVRVAPFYSTRDSSYTMFGLIASTSDPAATERVVPIIRFNTANTPNVFVHELAHAFVTTDCEAYHLCEVLSQAAENRIAPVRSFASDLPALMDATIVWDRSRPDYRTLDRAAFDAIVRTWLTEHEAYTGFDYTLGRVLGDAMVQNLGLRNGDDLGAMTRAIAAAHAATTPEDVARALGFADYRALSDAMARAYAAHVRAVRADPIASAQFNNLVRQAQPAAQARPPLTPPLTLSLPIPALPSSAYMPAYSSPRPGLPISPGSAYVPLPVIPNPVRTLPVPVVPPVGRAF